MDNVNLITYPDFVNSGFQVALINLEADQQQYISNLLLDLLYPTNIYQLELEVPDHITYNFSALNLADLIIFNKPNLWHWTTGLVVSNPRCFFIESDTTTVNILTKLSLRHAKVESLSGVIKDALQRKQQQQTNL